MTRRSGLSLLGCRAAEYNTRDCRIDIKEEVKLVAVKEALGEAARRQEGRKVKVRNQHRECRFYIAQYIKKCFDFE